MAFHGGVCWLKAKLMENLMDNDMKAEKSFFFRTFSKEEALDRKKFNLIENSDVPADSVNIENAIRKAKAEMEAELDFYARSKKK